MTRTSAGAIMHSTMKDFFHGWRRKAGCVTLLMASAVTVAWVRSRMIVDSVVLMNYYWFVSFRGRVVWTVFDFEHSGPWYWVSNLSDADDINRWMVITDSAHGGISYYLIAIPLTLLSACLLLWKPRQPTKPADPGMDFSQRHKDTERDENNSINNSDLPSVSP